MNINDYNLDSETSKNISNWLNGNYDETTKSQVRHLLKNNFKDAVDSFYTTLSFGTGGMRGIMGVGSNRLNGYTIRAATQGLANYIRKQPAPPFGFSIIIGYDSRTNSKELAQEAAKVLAANDIRVFLCENLRPTPLISFGCRFLRCTSAIVITASHNPPEYNGYKVYWSDGGQVLFPHDAGIIDEVSKIIDPSQVKVSANLEHHLISFIAEDIDVPYIAEGSRLQLYPQDNKAHGNKLNIVYTSLHGTGITLIPDVLKNWGFSTFKLVDKQVIPDGNFPTVNYPNPEELSALKMGIETLKESGGDILIATDPDADRIGIVARHNGSYIQLTGNQVAAILLEHVCHGLINQKAMPEKAAFVKTIVTTELFKAICSSYDKECFDVLPGFKYIAEKIQQWENDPNGYSYVFGGEESCGYLYNTLTRDKDGILISALLCEATLQAKLKNKTLIDLLHDIYKKHGVYVEGLLSIKFEESKIGKEKMNLGMTNLRSNIPKQICDIAVVAVDDYMTSTTHLLTSNITKQIPLPVSNVLTFWLADKTKIVVRPSGTEPKIKLYCGVSAPITHTIEDTENNCQNRVNTFLNTVKEMLNAE